MSTRILHRMRSLEDAVERALASRETLGAAVAVLTLAVASLRLYVSLSVPTVGGDYGHYLIAANWYAGVDRTGEGPFDPPFVPLIVLLLSPFLGKIITLQILGPLALASMLPAATFFLVRFVPRWAALSGAAVFVLWQQFAETIAFGGVTNLLGIAFSLVFYRLLFDALDEEDAGWKPRRIDLAASAVLFLVVSTHHLSAFILGATVLLWCALQMLLTKSLRGATIWTSVRIVGLGAALSIVYVPHLLGLVAVDAAWALGRPTGIDAVLGIIALVWRQTPAIWAAFLVVAVLAVFRLNRSSALTPAAVALALTPITLVLTVLASHPVRAMIYEQFPLVFLALLWTTRGRTVHLPRNVLAYLSPILRPTCILLLVISVAVLPVSSEAFHRETIAYYHRFQSEEMFGALDWIAGNTPTNAVIAVDGPTTLAFNEQWKGQVTGWWLEGYTNRRSIYEANLPLLSSLAKWDDARDANRLFAGDVVFEDGILRVADSFPGDDAAAPMVYSAYFRDYHEFIGVAAPQLVDSNTGEFYDIRTAANSTSPPELGSERGELRSGLLGPGFNGTRSITFDSRNHTVSLDLALTFDAGAGWDAVRLALRSGPWVKLDLGTLDAGIIQAQTLDAFGNQLETGTLEIAVRGLGLPAFVATGAPADLSALGLRWDVINRSVALQVRIGLTVLPSTGPAPHALTVRTRAEILATHGIGFLYVSAESASNVQRFDRDSQRYVRAFSNPSAVIYAIL